MTKSRHSRPRSQTDARPAHPTIDSRRRLDASGGDVEDGTPRGDATSRNARFPDDEEPALVSYLAILAKRRWSAVTAALMLLTGVVIHNVTTEPIYEATARVLVETDSLNLVDIEDVIDQRQSLDAEFAVLRSRWLARRTMASLGLLDAALPSSSSTRTSETARPSSVERMDGGEPTPAAPPRDGTVAATDAAKVWAMLLDFAARALGVGPAVPSGVPPAPRHVGVVYPMDDRLADARRVGAFLGGLSVSFTGASSSVLDVTYRSSDPHLTARFANAHAAEYIKQSLERRFSAVEEVTDWLSLRLQEQRDKVGASELALARFREANGLTAVDGESPAITRLNELTASRTRIQAERLEQEAAYNHALAMRRDPESLDRLPVMANDPTLQRRRSELEELQRRRVQLAVTHRDRHPDMAQLHTEIEAVQTRLEADRVRLLEALRHAVLATEAAELGLAEEVDELRQAAIAQERKGVQLSVLMREAESNKQIYDLLLQRAQETGVAKDLNPSRTRILDDALVPTSPVSPNRRRNIVAGLAGAVLLAFAVALGLERLDNRVKTPVEIGTVLGLPLIGLLPDVTPDDADGALLYTGNIAPQFAEELRHIRTNVLFSFSGAGSRSLAVASSGVAEGKSVVASNLAVALAQTDERVLLIDADMRRPTVHTTFEIDHETGLSNLLVGTQSEREVVRPSTQHNLWLLPAGHRPPNPSELLGSPELRRLLVRLGERFDWIIFDTPPVIAVTDACVLANAVSGVLFVVGCDRVSQPVARRAIGQLTSARGKVIGGVLNRVPVHRNRHYYSAYSAPYHSAYGGYYNREPPFAGDAPVA